jgi:hypothetical protein
MKGVVEVYSTVDGKIQDLLYQEDNMILDSGKEALVDMLTTKILPHENSALYKVKNFYPIFFGIGQTRAIEVSGGAHYTSSLASSATNQNTLSAFDLSSYMTKPPIPTDTKTNEESSDLSVFPNYLAFSGDYPEYTEAEMISKGTYVLSGGIGEGWDSANQYTFNALSAVNSEGYIYPPSYIFDNSVGPASEDYALQGPCPLSAVGATPVDTDTEVVIGIHFHGRDIGFLYTHYLSFQYIGLYTLDYYATRDKLKNQAGYETTFIKASGAYYPPANMYHLSRSTNPVMRPFAKKALQMGPLLGPYTEFNQVGGAIPPYDTAYDKRGIAIIWRLKFV